MSAPDAIAGAYHALAQRAWDTNRARLRELTTVLDEWRSVGVLGAERRDRGRSLAHSLRGSAGTFGHDQAAEAADELQTLLLGEAVPQLDDVAVLVERIDHGLAEPPDLPL